MSGHAAATTPAPSETVSQSTETIFALSSGALPAGIAVIRMSGPRAHAALRGLCDRRLPPPRRAALRTLADAHGAVIDRALVLVFAAPDSATGEDVAEIHAHGGIAVVAALIAALGQLPGLRLANPGEFTRRAFENGRLDLSQVEGLADLIAAETEAQRVAALAHADGALRQAIARWSAVLTDLRAGLEASLDFADGEDDVAARLDDDAGGQGGGAVAGLIAEIAAALAGAARARALRGGLTVVLSGAPNVGKSSLINALSRREVSLVSPVAGTTRDAVEARLDLRGVLVTLVDTAGLRDAGDPVEAAGVARARARAASADLVLTLFDTGDLPQTGVPVQTKVDLAGVARPDTLAVSSLTGQGLAELEDWLTRWATGVARPREPSLIANERQRAACIEARDALARLADGADPVLQAEALRLAQRALGRVSGLVGVEDILDAIFARFCIGK